MKFCGVVPVYEHGATLGAVLDALAKHDLRCIVVDDGSGLTTATDLDALVRTRPGVELLRFPENRGKGVAVRQGLVRAAERGFSHALLIDADGQHQSDDIGRFLDAARRAPDALVLGYPVFDASAPLARRWGRLISRVWAWIETLSFDIGDPLFGYRCVPLAATMRMFSRNRLGARMDFDPEFAVRMVWDGVPIVNVPTAVRYPRGGISHFDPLRDNLRLIWLNTRLFFGMLLRIPILLRGRRRR